MTIKITEEDLQSALPDVTSTLCTAELQFPVTIIRDNFGIPRASVSGTECSSAPTSSDGILASIPSD